MLGLVAGLVLSQSAAGDEAARQAAVATWFAKVKKPQLSVKDARAVEACVELPSWPGSGCAQVARLCRVHEGDDGSSGTRLEALSFVLEGSDRKLRVWWTATYEPRLSECDPPEPVMGHESPEARAAEVAAWRKAHPKEYAKCVARVEKDARDDAEELGCEVVAVDACRAEAWARCSSRNLRKGMTVLTHLHRVEL